MTTQLPGSLPIAATLLPLFKAPHCSCINYLSKKKKDRQDRKSASSQPGWCGTCPVGEAPVSGSSRPNLSDFPGVPQLYPGKAHVWFCTTFPWLPCWGRKADGGSVGSEATRIYLVKPNSNIRHGPAPPVKKDYHQKWGNGLIFKSLQILSCCGRISQLFWTSKCYLGNTH